MLDDLDSMAKDARNYAPSSSQGADMVKATKAKARAMAKH